MSRSRVAILAGLALSLTAFPVRALDLTAFVATGAPSETWGRGYGASLGSRWFGVVTFEGEAQRLPLETATPGAQPEGSMTAFTAAALVSPPLELIVPYGGIGVGLFRQTLGSRSDTGRLSALVLGVRAKLGPVFARAEYRDYSFSSEPLLPLDKRYSLGVGLSF